MRNIIGYRIFLKVKWCNPNRFLACLAGASARRVEPAPPKADTVGMTKRGGSAQGGHGLNDKMFMKSQQEEYDELAYYTLEKHDPEFIHQYIVDAFAAQTADAKTKPITLAFALIGLYLHLEKNYTGKQVQRAHMILGKTKKAWPKFELPSDRGAIKVTDVLAVPAGPERDAEINKWCVSVWKAYNKVYEQVKDLAQTELQSL
jgi:Family of unknown function (DUF5946)